MSVTTSLHERFSTTPGGEKVKLCTQCGTCSASCPTSYAWDYTPRRLWRMIQVELDKEALGSRTFWLCTSCASCQVRCPQDISLTEALLTLKRLAVEEGLPVPPAIAEMGAKVAERHNISGEDNASRLIWSQNLPKLPPGLERKRGAETIYFVGCVSSFYPMAYSIPQALVGLMERAGLDFTTLGGEEWCCGYPLHNGGLDGELSAIAEHNLQRVLEIGAKRLVFTCPSCYYAWKHIYPQVASMPSSLKMLHATELLAELIERKKLEPGPLEQVATYHDPCDLGRKSGIFEAPRLVLKSIPGLELREMATSKENALCCGGGGDVEMASAEISAEVAERRLKQAAATGAAILISACQQCKRTLSMAARRQRLRIQTLDLSELVLRSIEAGLLNSLVKRSEPGHNEGGGQSI